MKEIGQEASHKMVRDVVPEEGIGALLRKGSEWGGFAHAVATGDIATGVGIWASGAALSQRLRCLLLSLRLRARVSRHDWSIQKSEADCQRLKQSSKALPTGATLSSSPSRATCTM